jgi:hypothetical protein
LLAEYEHGGFDFHYHGSYSFVAKSKPESSEGGREGGRAAGESLSTYVVAVKQDIYTYTLMEGEGGEGNRYHLAPGAPLRPFASPSPPSPSLQEGENLREDGAEDGAEEDDESNSIVGVTLTEDGTVVVAAKVGGHASRRREGGREGGKARGRGGGLLCSFFALSLSPLLQPSPA